MLANFINLKYDFKFNSKKFWDSFFWRIHKSPLSTLHSSFHSWWMTLTPFLFAVILIYLFAHLLVAGLGRPDWICLAQMYKEEDGESFWIRPNHLRTAPWNSINVIITRGIFAKINIHSGIYVKININLEIYAKINIEIESLC